MITLYEKDITPLILTPADTFSVAYTDATGNKTVLVDSVPVQVSQQVDHVKVVQLEPGEFGLMGGLAAIMGQKS
jgi:hypothetical protein